RAAEARAELVQDLARRGLVVAAKRAVEPRELGAVLVAHGRLEHRRQVTRRRPVHPRDLHVAAEREDADAVLDVPANLLHDRRPEAEVELARRHSDRARGEEVPCFVNEHQQREPDDRRYETHTASLARRSASRSSSRSRAGAPSTSASTLSTSAAMSRKPMRPSRNAATATSFAALNAHGYVPPRSPASRASARRRNVSVSGSKNSSGLAATRSSAGIGVAARSGYVSAYEIGTRMSG